MRVLGLFININPEESLETLTIIEEKNIVSKEPANTIQEKITFITKMRLTVSAFESVSSEIKYSFKEKEKDYKEYSYNFYNDLFRKSLRQAFDQNTALNIS